MKKTIVLLLTLVLCIAVLSGCGCEHQWLNATCTTPKTCELCQEIEGDPLGHTWDEATCDAPKTCSVCAATEGAALGHTWTDATCDAPKTCSVCSEIEGEPLAHTWGDWADIDIETEQRICSLCETTEEQSIDRKARLLLLLEGDWETTAVYISDLFYTYDELESLGMNKEDAMLYLNFKNDGTGTMTSSIDTVDIKISGDFDVTYEAEDYAYYSFAFFSDGSTVTSLLFEEGDEEIVYELWLSISNVIFVFEQVA